MKNLIITLLIACVVFDSNAQQQVTDATINYDIYINKMGQEKNTSNIPNASYKLSVKGSLTKSEFTNSLGTETTIYNSKTETGVILKEYSGQKLLVKLTKQDWLSQNQLFMNLEFTMLSQTKKIEGKEFNIATASLNNGGKLTVYFNPSINLSNNNYTIAFPHINGLPVQFENVNNGINYVYKLKDINYDIVPLNNFDIPTSGYRIISYKDAVGLKKEN